MSYVEVPADRLRAKLAEMGFTQIQLPFSNEEIYERRHHVDPSYLVRVYSSISSGSKAVRGCGEDAIRVVALRCIRTAEWREDRKWRTEGVAKTKRIHRTGTVEGVLQRLHERAREAYAVINQRLKQQRRAS